MDTPRVRFIIAKYPDLEAARAVMKERQPLGHLVIAEEIAAMAAYLVAAYLASGEASSSIGACMVVDSGMTAG